MGNNLVIIGAGPSGLSCAYKLSMAGEPSILIEKESAVGGLCRTINFGGYLFDIGGHRFFSESAEINTLWKNIMADDMLRVQRLSRIYYKKRFYNYPLSFFNTFRNLGPVETLSCVTSYLRSCLLHPGDDKMFEGWVINRFGKRLYEIFFKTYTEKVWSIACRDISADWAKERIRGLSLKTVIQKAVFGISHNVPKTLNEEFLYPKYGPGEFYERLKKLVELSGSSVLYRKTVTGINHDGEKILSLESEDALTGEGQRFLTDYLFSSMPLPLLINIMNPRPPAYVIAAANGLRFRSILIVNLILNKEQVFPDQWIYIHSPEVRLGRIQNYKNWSRSMVPDAVKTSLGLEYFCSVGDPLWKMNDVDIINLALEELEKLGIASRKYLINGFVVRQASVYPVYSLGYRENVDVIGEYLNSFSNLGCMGRAGLFRYDNSDQALLSGMYAARKFLGEPNHKETVPA